MKKSRIWQIGLGVVLVAAMAIPMVSCGSSSSATTSQTTSATTTTTSATTTKTTTTATTSATTTATTTSAVKKFIGLADVPTISNKTPINVALEAGGSAGVIIPYIEKFSQKTGVPVTTESMIMTVIYPKINVELLSGTGAYDITVVEGSTTCEWAPYLWKMNDLADRFDPQGRAGLAADMAGIHPAMLRTSSDADNNLMGMVYYTYQQVMLLRQDIFDNATEKANFKTKYGYDLAPATTQQQVLDQGAFFTRAKGETLAGKPLTEQVYGLSIMAGQFEINDEFFTHIYGDGGGFFTTIRDANGKVTEFRITKKDYNVQVNAMKQYKMELPYASPGCLTGFWDFCSAQMESGLTVVIPHMYVSLDQWCWGVQEKVGGTLGLYQVVGGQGYIGGFHQAVALASKNPEASYWLARYVASYENQNAMAHDGWSSPRMDVYETPANQVAYSPTKGGVYRSMTQRGAILRKVWDYQVQFTNDYVEFNDDAMGKIYEQEIVILHKGAIGDYSPEECINQLSQVSIDLGNKFSSIPHTWEK
jgi:multiple sugar transport system substrate-binding protein